MTPNHVWLRSNLRLGGLRILLPLAALLVVSLGVLTGSRTGTDPAASQSSNNAAVATTGWLYVLDTQKGSSEPGGQILVVDPAQSNVVRTYKVGYRPDMVLSPDGNRLYVTSNLLDNKGNSTLGNAWHNVLEVYDTTTGGLVNRIDNPDELIYTAEDYPTTMSISPNGKWIYMLKNHQTAESDDYYIAAFDTASNVFLPGHVSMPDCAGALLLPTSQDATVDVLCSEGSVTEITFANQSFTRRKLPITGFRQGLKQTERRTVGVGVLTPGEQKITLLTGDGATFNVNRSNGFAQRGQPLNLASDRWIRMQYAPFSKSQGSVYFGSGRRPWVNDGSDQFDQITKADPSTLAPQLSISSAPFSTMTLRSDGSVLYTVDPERAVITVRDAATLQQIQQLSNVGQYPIWAVAAP